MSTQDFVSCLNHVRDDMTEEQVLDFAHSVIALTYKFSAEPSKLGQEITSLVRDVILQAK